MKYFAAEFSQTQQGFTIAEVIVTVTIVTIFLIIFSQNYLVLESQRINVARRARASDVAYTNLHKVPARPTQLNQQLCTNNAAIMDLTTGNPSSKPGLDITQYGYQLESDSDLKKVLGSNAAQTLTVYAPNGCAVFDSSPIKVVAKVTYGTNGESITHARYVK